MTEHRSGTIAISIEAPAGLLEQVDVWAADQTPPVTRSAAIHDLLRAGLASQDAAAEDPRPGKNTERSAGMAGKVIDSLGDQSATADDRAHRKKRLLKGPEEFRGMRDDRRAARRKE